MYGGFVNLKIYVAGQPEVKAEEIHWYRPDGSEILAREGILHDNSTRFFLNFVQEEDVGRYTIEIMRNVNLTNVSTTFNIVINGECSAVEPRG